MSEESLQFLRISALLHDVGKPECWANREPWSEHVNLTYKLVKAYLGEDFACAAMRHHMGSSYPKEINPKTDIERVICIADNLSSGADRQEEPERGSPLPSPPIRLTHALSKGNLVLNESDPAKLGYATQEVAHSLEEIKSHVQTDPRRGYLKLFESLMHSSLVRIPADTRTPINDVSLWDHLKLTAAFATCMWLDGGYKGLDLDRYEFAVVSGDADRISSFVNLSSRLPDLNGRSAKVSFATERAKSYVAEALGPECLIFAGGGGLLVVSPVGKAEQVAEGVKASFEGASDGLVTLTVSYLKARGKTLQKEFGKVWRQAQWQMRLKKSARLPVTVTAVDDKEDVCDVCHVRPSTHDSDRILPYDASPRPERLCDVCWQLRGEGRGATLDELKDRSNLVAVLRADGDDVGQVLGGNALERIGKASTPSRLATISRILHSTCEKDLLDIIVNSNGKCLIAGGDDILAVLPAERALETAVRLSQLFKRQMAEVCTMSAGIAIFRYDLPIYAGLEVASALLKVAKNSGHKNAVAFAMVGGVGFTAEEVEDIRHGPLKWDELEDALRLSNLMAGEGMASTQVRKIATVAQRDPVLAEVLIKSLMGKGEKGRGLSWSDGEQFLFYLKSGIFSDAFAVYNAFKSGEDMI